MTGATPAFEFRPRRRPSPATTSGASAAKARSPMAAVVSGRPRSRAGAQSTVDAHLAQIVGDQPGHQSGRLQARLERLRGEAADGPHGRERPPIRRPEAHDPPTLLVDEDRQPSIQGQARARWSGRAAAAGSGNCGRKRINPAGGTSRKRATLVGQQRRAGEPTMAALPGVLSAPLTGRPDDEAVGAGRPSARRRRGRPRHRVGETACLQANDRAGAVVDHHRQLAENRRILRRRTCHAASAAARLLTATSWTAKLRSRSGGSHRATRCSPP